MKKTSSYSVIPESESPCVWMDAGVTEYKLCDQKFRCETCPFDQEMQQKRAVPVAAVRETSPRKKEHRAQTAEGFFADSLNERMARLRAVSMPEEKMFHRSHYWTIQHGPTTYRIGVNHVLASFLQPILSVVVSKAPISLHRLDPFCWIILPGGAVTLRAPLDATIARFNPALQQKPALLHTAPFEDGWLMEITTKSKSLNGFMSPREFQPHHEEELQNIAHIFTKAYQYNASSTGTTLFDGGVALDTIEAVFGPKVYLEIVNRIAHSPT